MKQNADEREAYTIEEAARITGVRPSTIRYWAGPYGRVIRAEVADSGRQGSRKLLSPRNLVQIRVAFLLSEAGWPKALVTRELRRALDDRKRPLDWYTPGRTAWGKVEWFLFADRKAWNGHPWTLASIGGPSTPGEPHSWIGSAWSAWLGDFEATTLTWPDGWKLVGEGFPYRWVEQMVGVRRLTIINLARVKKRISEHV